MPFRLTFSCTQSLMTPVSPNTQKDSLEDRVCALASSVFLLVDASFHLLAAAYKGFAWTAAQIFRKNPPDYYKEAYSHFIKALRCTSVIPIGSLVGVIDPSIFQSLQEYLGWKGSLANTSETIENKTLKEEIKRLKLQVDSLNKIIPSAVSQDNSQSPKANLASAEMANANSYVEDTISLSSDEEFVDAVGEFRDLNEMLEKESLSKNEEIKRLKLQIDLLNKILYPLKTLYPYNQVLVIQKALNKSIIDTPIIYQYLSTPIKKEINDVFQDKFNRDFPQFCHQKNPDIDATSAIFADLLNKHTFRSWTSPKEASISAVINTLFGFV